MVILELNNSRCNNNSVPAVLKVERGCVDCHYALFPNTGRCTNYECPYYDPQPGGMNGDKIIDEYAPPSLFHGRRWGSWTLDVERWCLVYRAFPIDLGNGSGRTSGVPPYTAFWGDYEIDLERNRDSAAMLDWIFQIRGKAWASACVMRDLIEALYDVFDPQASLCGSALVYGSGVGGKAIDKPGAFLRERIATVGKDVPMKDGA